MAEKTKLFLLLCVPSSAKLGPRPTDAQLPTQPNRWSSSFTTAACPGALRRRHQVRRGEPAPGLLGEGVLDLGRAVEHLAGNLDQPGREQMVAEEDAGRRFALKAAGEATVVLDERQDLPTSVLVGQARSTAVDLLRASGMPLDEAAGELDSPVRSVSECRNRSGECANTPA
jgi:hypothetical protein